VVEQLPETVSAWLRSSWESGTVSCRCVMCKAAERKLNPLMFSSEGLFGEG
jgi:hypothetical protein